MLASVRAAGATPLFLCAALFTASLSHSQVTRLPFRPVDAAYSLALDRAIFIAAAPNQLHIYDVGSNNDQTVALPDTPLNLSLSADGIHAAVAFTNSLSYVDLQAASIVQTFSGLSVGSGKVIVGSGYLYVMPSYSGNMISLNLANGQSTTSGGFSYAAGGVFDPALNTVYSTQDGISPNSLQRFDTSNGPIAASATGPPSYYFGVFNVCGPLTLSHDGSTIYSGCGTIFRASATASQDMRYLGILPGVNGIRSLSTADSLHQIAAIPRVPSYAVPPATLADTVVDLFDAGSFQQIGQFATTPFTVQLSSFPAHGRWAFYNAASTRLFVVTQADSSAALTQDFAVESIDLTASNSCNAQFGGTSISAIAAGAYGSTPILAGEDCVYTAASNVSWIVLTSGYYGSGNATLNYLVRPNLSAGARSGTITLGSHLFTIAQDAPSAFTSFTPLSYQPVAADYDKHLECIVLVSAAPNELHLYDPLTQSDQIVPLASRPLSVSVRPDGLFAAVGHSGFISIVDLQAAAVTATFPVDMDNAGILLASNGFAYAFPMQTSSWAAINSVRLSNGTVTPLLDVYYGNVPRLDSSGNYLYVAGPIGGSKLDISGGPARVAPTSNAFGVGSNIWLNEDGTRLLANSGSAFFTSVNPALDLSAAGKLSAANNVSWAANAGSLAETAVLTDASPSGNAQLQIYADNGLLLENQLSLPGFPAGAQTFKSHGRYLFWNASETKLFAIVQADSASGLASDYAVYVVDSPSALPSCTYGVSPALLSLSATASTAYFDVVSNCNWLPVASGGANWFSLSSSGPTTGNGRVNLYVYTSSGAARSASILVGNQSVMVNQAAAGCTFSFPSGGQTFAASGGTGSLAFATAPACNWSVQTNAAWLTTTSASSGSGPASVSFSVAPNLTGASRVASLSIAGNSFQIVESAAPVSPAANFVPMTPCRVADTRDPAGPFGGPFLAAQSTRTFSFPNSHCNIPTEAISYALNVTVVPHGGLNYLTAWPGDGIQPFVSTLNARDGRTKANAAIIDAGASKSVSFFATDDTELIVDVTGYFVDASSGSGLAFYQVTPCRIVDSRSAAGSLGGPVLSAGEPRDLPVLQSNCQLPAQSQAYALNFTSVPVAGPLAYLTTWPSGGTKPLVSTLNAVTGAVTANAAILQAGTQGSISVFATDQSHLIIDTTGYFAPPAGSGLHFHSIDPCRALDTRETLASPFKGVLPVQIGGSCNVPVTASAVVLNATVVPGQTLSYLTLWPAGASQPLVSTLNAYDGAVTSNMAIVPIVGGAISAFATEGTHLIIDVTGYFAP